MARDDPTLSDVFTEVVRLGERLDHLIKTGEDHEQRLRGLERWRYALPASVVVGLGSLVTAAALKH